MSGFVCPDCSGTYFAGKKDQLECELCGWVGKNDGSTAWLTDEAYDDNARRHAAVNAGKLFVFRVHLKGPDKDRDAAVSAIMKLLSISGMGGTDGKGETRYKAELQTRPSDETIAKIKKLKTVEEASVWP